MEAQVSRGYARYALGLLTLVVLINFMDRQIIAILAEPIKNDLGLSDGQVGLMAGLSFALLYTTLSLPIAWLADRWHRPRIIAIAIAAWSVMTVLCGMAANFVQLFIARIGVGVGEAGSGPASHSLLSDIFPPERRAGAFGIYGLGIPVGGFVAYAGGGWIVQEFGWRTAFIAAGAPGILIALLVALTLREPRTQSAQSSPHPPGAFQAAMRELAAKPTYWHLIIGATLVAFVAYGFAAFYGGFFVRIHGMGYAQLGLALGVMVGISGAFGAWSGGAAADYFGKRSVGAQLLVPGIILIAAAPLFAIGLYAPNKWIALTLFAAPTIAATFYYGPTFASVQGLAKPHTRAMASAIFTFITSLIGMGLGPVFSGFLSDTFTAQRFAALTGEAFASACAMGDARTDACADAEAGGLRLALLVLSAFNIWAAMHFIIAARTLRQDLARQ